MKERVCDRCHKITRGYIMSMFNTEEICMTCKTAEEKDPRYEEARRREIEECKRGEF